MKSKTIISMLVLTVFFAGLFVLPAFAQRKYQPVVQGENRWAVKTEVEPSSSEDIAEGTENLATRSIDEAGNMVDRSLSAADALIVGALTFSSDAINGSMDSAGRMADEAGNTVDGTMQGDTSASQGLLNEADTATNSVIDGSLAATGALIDGTGTFIDESVSGATDAVFGPSEDEMEVEIYEEDVYYDDLEDVESYGDEEIDIEIDD